MPYPELFKFLEPLALNMGGISGSLGSQKHRSVFFSADSIGAAPLICYESIYGEYTNEYVQRGANILFIITNDGWWGNTAGYKQHVQYGRLRAIETRRDVAQSANTGTSAFINQRGDLYDATPWWQPEVIKTLLMANRSETIYVKYGDVIGRISVMTTIVLLVISVFLWFKKKISPGKNHCMNLEKICKELNPKFPFTYKFSDEEYQKLYTSEQLVSRLTSYFSILGIFISCLGLLGLVLFTSEQRTPEFGIRKVLGASPVSLFNLLSREFLRLVLIALLIASPLAWLAMNKWLENYEYRVPVSWWMFVTAGVLAILIALLTVSFQAIKSARANPVTSLRSE
jgi:hypothetical protein